MARRRHSHADPPATPALLAEVRAASRPLRTPADLDPLLARVGDARCVLLGEATHGTCEFYTWRAELTRRLVAERGFTFVAVEGDWPACSRVNRFVKGGSDAASAEGVLGAFDRWPTWMWANAEVAEFVDWLRGHNAGRPAGERAGFYGLDVYSLWESLGEVMGYLREHDGPALAAARRAARCFQPYDEDAYEYARATRLVPEVCEDEVVTLLRAVRGRAAAAPAGEREAAFEAEQNALVLKNAEAYYRAMVRGRAESWNVRDRHMGDTLGRLLAHHGLAAKAVVWAHNTHVGDARFTDMADDGMVNLGQLARERYGHEAVLLVGFGTHSGAVIAGAEWDAPAERMPVPDARAESWEDVLHRAGGDRLLLFDPSAAGGELGGWRGHRAVGVVYDPGREQFGNYVPTVLPRRYDAFLFLDRTRAVRPLGVPAHPGEVPETFPSGV